VYLILNIVNLADYAYIMRNCSDFAIATRGDEVHFQIECPVRHAT
jgi:hypothetical protein